MNNILFLLLALVPLLLVSALSNNLIHAATPTTQNMTKYTDPEGRFTISYPVNWTAQPAGNRFESPLVTFDSGVGPNSNIVIITGVGTDPEAFARQVVNTANQYTLFQNVECAKYKIDEQRACSFIFTKQADSDLGTPDAVIMQVLSYINGNMYTINFAASQNTFDSLLPTFEAMISSFKAGS